MNNTLSPNNSNLQQNAAVVLATDSATANTVYTAFGGTIGGQQITVLQRRVSANGVDSYAYYVAEPNADFLATWADRATLDYTTTSDAGGLVLPFLQNVTLGTLLVATVTAAVTVGTVSSHATVGATFTTLPNIACKKVVLWNTNPSTAEDMEVARGAATTGIPLPPGSAWEFAVVSNANELKIRRWSQVAGAITMYYEAIN